MQEEQTKFMLSLTFVGAWFSSFKIPPKFIDSVLIYLFRRMYRDIFWANCKLQIIASPCICNRVACPRGMETAYLNHCLHYSYVVLVSWSHSLLMEAKRNVFCLLVIKFYFRFVQRCLFFLYLASQKCRLTQWETQNALWYSTLACPVHMLRVNTK